MLEEFRKFIARGNVIDLAVGVIIGAAFTGIINSLVTDIINPLIGLATGGRTNFANYYIPLAGQADGLTLEAAREIGAVLAYGNFITAILNFLIVAFVLFMLIRTFNQIQERFKAEEKAEAATEAASAPPAPEVALLGEIRDLLKQQASNK